MAGSYNHIVDEHNNFIGTDLLDNMGDAYEALEECYKIIQSLSCWDVSSIQEAIDDLHRQK